MGKRTAAIAVLLALTFLGSLLALAVVGGVRGVRVTPALGPAEPLMPGLEGPQVEASPADPGPSLASPSPERSPVPSEDGGDSSTGSPPAPSADTAVEPVDQIAVEPPQVEPPPLVEPPVVAPPVAVAPVLAEAEEVAAGSLAAKNGSGGKGDSKGSVKDKTKPSKKNGSNGKANGQTTQQSAGTNGSTGHADQPSEDEDGDDDGHGSDGE